MTQADLAEKVFINKNYLSHIESGSANKVMSLPLLIRISKALDVELALLVDLSELNNSENEIREQIFNKSNQIVDGQVAFSRFIVSVKRLRTVKIIGDFLLS